MDLVSDHSDFGLRYLSNIIFGFTRVHDRKIEQMLKEAKDILIVIQGGKIYKRKQYSQRKKKISPNVLNNQPQRIIEDITNSIDIARLDNEAKLEIEDAEYLRAILQKGKYLKKHIEFI